MGRNLMVSESTDTDKDPMKYVLVLIPVLLKFAGRPQLSVTS